jgi:acyl carrier protein
MANRATLETVKGILRESLRLGPETEIADDMPLIGGTHDLDSLDTLLVMTTIERQFGIALANGEFDRSAFASVRTIADYIDLRLQR